MKPATHPISAFFSAATVSACFAAVTVPALSPFSLSRAFSRHKASASRATSTICFDRSNFRYALSISIPRLLSIRARFSSACDCWATLWPISPFRFPQSKDVPGQFGTEDADVLLQKRRSILVAVLGKDCHVGMYSYFAARTAWRDFSTVSRAASSSPFPARASS